MRIRWLLWAICTEHLPQQLTARETLRIKQERVLNSLPLGLEVRHWCQWWQLAHWRHAWLHQRQHQTQTIPLNCQVFLHASLAVASYAAPVHQLPPQFQCPFDASADQSNALSLLALFSLLLRESSPGQRMLQCANHIRPECLITDWSARPTISVICWSLKFALPILPSYI